MNLLCPLADSMIVGGYNFVRLSVVGCTDSQFLEDDAKCFEDSELS